MKKGAAGAITFTLCVSCLALPAGNAAEGRARPRGRFRLSVSAALATANDTTAYGEQGSFSFPNEPTAEAGPYPTALTLRSIKGPVRVGLGPVRLSYDWRPHWSLEAEYFAHGRSWCSWDGPLTFTSSADGLGYYGYFYHGYRARFYSLLLGLSYHPLVQDTLQRHDFEFGVAVGPAWVSGAPFAPDIVGQLSLPPVRKAFLSGRILAGYDHAFARFLSLGLFAGYRHMQKRLPGTAASGLRGFIETGNEAGGIVFERLTEISLPPSSLRAGGVFFGLKFGIRI